VNILLVNWQDRLNPQAGGAEVHLFEVFTRLAARGHRVRLVCSGWEGAAEQAVVDGIEVHRSGNRTSFTWSGRGAVRRALEAELPDILVEDINKLPLFLSPLTPAPLYVIIPHLFGDTIFHEASIPAASLVWLAERPIPRAYRRAQFHAISESTRDDLVQRGVPADRVRVIHPGVDAVLHRPDSAARSPSPSFLYLGRLKRYKGVETAIRALGLARATRPDLILDIAGSGDDRGRLESIVRELGLVEAGALPRLCDRSRETSIAAIHLGQHLSLTQRGLGHHDHRSGSQRHPIACVGQSRPQGFGPARGHRLPGAAR
jgi:glycosyltransferase involved in cell wall biosynthesis